MKIHIDGQRVLLSDLRAAWQSPTTVTVGETVVARIAESNAHIKTVLAGGEQVYGVNTGFGQMAQVRISDDELVNLQERLVRSHASDNGSSPACSSASAAGTIAPSTEAEPMPIKALAI